MSKEKEFEFDLSYQDLIEYTSSTTIKARNVKEAINKLNKNITKIINAIDWDEESVGDGFEPHTDEIRELDKDGETVHTFDEDGERLDDD